MSPRGYSIIHSAKPPSIPRIDGGIRPWTTTPIPYCCSAVWTSRRHKKAIKHNNHSHLVIVLHCTPRPPARPPRTAYRALPAPGRPPTWPAPPEPRRSTPTKGGDSRTLRASLRLHVSQHLGGRGRTLLPVASSRLAGSGAGLRMRERRCCRAVEGFALLFVFFFVFLLSDLARGLHLLVEKRTAAPPPSAQPRGGEHDGKNNYEWRQTQNNLTFTLFFHC